MKFAPRVWALATSPKATRTSAADAMFTPRMFSPYSPYSPNSPEIDEITIRKLSASHLRIWSCGSVSAALADNGTQPWEGQMNWTNVADILFHVGAFLAAGFVVYGGWLSITAPGVDPHNAPGDGRPRGANAAPRRHGSALSSTASS